MDKPAWRRRIRAQRAEMVIDHDGHARALSRFLADAIPDGARVVVYDALADEVALDRLIDAHPDPGRRFVRTRTPDHGHRLTLHPHGGPSEQHRYGFAQPRADGPQVPDDEIGAVLVPGLAFDRQGVRLGRGGGYYDRLLARLGPEVLRIGLTAGIIVDRLPAEDHDVAMTHLVTADAVLTVPLDETEVGSLSSW